MKIVVILFVIGMSLASGGVAVLAFSGYEFLSMDLWMLGFQSIVQSPGGVLEEVVKGSRKDLFGGVLAGIAGAAMVALSIVGIHLVWVASGVRVVVKRRRVRMTPDRSGARSRRIGKKAEGGAMAKKRRSVSDAGKRAVNWLGSGKRGMFRDRIADLGDAGEKTPWTRRLKNWFEQRIERRRKSRAPVIINPGSGNEVVVEYGDEKEFQKEIGQWFRGLRNVDSDDPEAIARARDLKEGLTEEIRKFIDENDPMNGEFMIRMLEAWAAKKGADSTDSDSSNAPRSVAYSGENAAYIEAIADVSRRGVKDPGEQDDRIPEEGDDEDFVDDLDGILEGSGDGGEDGDEVVATLSRDRDDEALGLVLDPSSEKDETPGNAPMKSVERARAVMNFLDICEMVQAGEGEWDEDLAEADVRQECIDGMMSDLSSTVAEEWGRIDAISPFDLDEDAEVIEWIQKNARDMEGLRGRLESGALVRSHEEGAEASASGVETHQDSDIVGGSGVPEESSDDGGGMDRHAPGEDGRDDRDDRDDRDAVAGAGDPVEISAPGRSEPRDVALDQLKEIDRSGDLIYTWGSAMRGAGAAEARLCHVVLAKDGVKRRVVGIVHLVAKWRMEESDESIRANVILRYVPDGEWSLDRDAKTPKMMNQAGDFVEVPGGLAEQPEVADAVGVVHFYGPGAPHMEKYEQHRGWIIVTRPLRSDEIRGIMGV